MAGGFHPPVEEYLEAIYGLSEEGVDVIQARLVERLGYSPQAVSEMVHRLIEDGYLDRTRRNVSLTDKGAAQARSVVRRHRLAERFLVDIVGLPWHKAHEEAGRWEHVISDDVEARFVELLGNPTTCPHGSPIPGSGGAIEPGVAMDDVMPGTNVRVTRVTERIETDNDALIYCEQHGLRPGQEATILGRAPDGTLTLRLDAGANETIAIGPSLSRNIYVAIS